MVHVPGDRWIRTYSEETLRALLEGFEVLSLLPTHYVPSGPFEMAAGPLDLQGVLQVEARLRAEPHTRHLHRAWMFAARAR